MDELSFEPVKLSDKELVDSYMLKYGEMSTQYSFGELYFWYSSFRDSICERDNWLYVQREALETEKRIYFMSPVGDYDDEVGFAGAVNNILDYAHNRGKKVIFKFMTKRQEELLEKFFFDRFDIDDNRDYYQYIHTAEHLATLSGKKRYRRKTEVRAFYAEYGERLEIKELTKENAMAVLEYQKSWLKQMEEYKPDDKKILLQEYHGIEKLLKNLEKFDYIGFVFYIDGKLCGYDIATAISGSTLDDLYQKGDREYKHINIALENELAKRACGKYKYINREEDLGNEGLRRAKKMYGPDMMLEVFEAKER